MKQKVIAKIIGLEFLSYFSMLVTELLFLLKNQQALCYSLLC